MDICRRRGWFGFFRVWPDHEFRSIFRCARSTLESVFRWIRGVIESIPKQWQGDLEIPPLFRLVVFWFRYASGETCRSIGRRVGLSTSSVWRITEEISTIFVARQNEVIRFPKNEEDLFALSEGFRVHRTSKLPHVVGAVMAATSIAVHHKNKSTAIRTARKI